jgi:hypothetical protein
VRSKIAFDDDGLEVRYKTFARPLVVPKATIRVAMIDQAPGSRRAANGRFPIAGEVPAGSFADALDNFPRAPWEDIDPERRERKPTPGVILEDYGRGPRLPSGYRHDDPSRDGWASSGGSYPPPIVRQGYLWSGHGSSLPFLRIGPGDVPNLAIIFHEPQRAPGPPWWFLLSPLQRWYHFYGGRSVRGLLLRVEGAGAAENALKAWGVVRQVAAEDVVDEGILVAKPLKGKRAILYGAAFAASMLGPLIFRHLR